MADPYSEGSIQLLFGHNGLPKCQRTGLRMARSKTQDYPYPVTDPRRSA